MTTDARALIAEGMRHMDAVFEPGSDFGPFAEAVAWCRSEFRAVLTGYSAALDEVDRLTSSLSFTDKSLTAAIAENVALRVALDEVERLKGNQATASVEQTDDPDPFEDVRIEELISIPVALMSNEELGVLESECLSIGGERGGRLRAALFELRRHRADLAALRTALTKLRADLNGTGWETEVDRILEGEPCTTTK